MKWKMKRTPDLSVLDADPMTRELPEVVRRILVLRGFDTPQKVRAHLHSELSDMHDPTLMKDMDKAVARIRHAIVHGETITVFGDYDADGVTSTSIAVELLEHLGANVHFWVNDRFKHGYGIGERSVEDMLQKFPDTKLIVTVDNGISAFDGIQRAYELGLEVVVTDHHDVGDTVPTCEAVVNPHQKDCAYPFKSICGAAVIFKTMLALYHDLGEPIERVYETLDLVALGTVADVMPLVGENRIFVKKGFDRIMRGERKAFAVMYGILEPYGKDARSVLGFSYGPAINAIGRLDGDPTPAVELFLTKDEARMEEIATYLKNRNEDRKSLSKEMTDIALALVEQKGLHHVNVVYSPDFNQGLTGLVASRLKETYNRPFFVFADGEGGIWKGSGRGIDGFHLKQAMDSCKETMVGYGGHAKAAGLSIRPENIDAFQQALDTLCKEALSEEDLIPTITVEVPLTEDEVTVELVEGLQVLEPFGEGFPPPVFGLRELKVNELRKMGTDKQHLKLQGKKLSLLMWNAGTFYEDLGSPKTVKAIGSPEINEYRGRKSIQFLSQDGCIRPA